MNNLSIYNEIVKSRGLRKLDYQEEFLTSEYNSTKPFVLAAGTSSGKTFMAIMKLEIFYSYAENKNKRTLIIPYAMKVLRDNFSHELNGFKPSFSYCVATTKQELIDCLKSDCQVVVALPQSLENSIDLLPTFHNFIIDEAHQWYGKKTINTILKKIKPKYQLLLTGTPARFIAKGDSFNFQFVPVMHLFGLKQVTNVRIEVVSSTYDFKQSDYEGNYGNLKGGRITKENTDDALIAVCKEMLKRIKNPIKQPNLSRVTKNVLSVFNQIGKTIVFCNSVKQADAIFNSLNGFKDLTGKVLVSHSKNDPNSENFITFKDNDSYSILVAVDRGKLGFNIAELFNVVDFTLTQSLDMLMQMFGRVLRLSKTDNPKTYYKVATKNTAPYYVDLMTAMLCLTDMEWYSKYNGKNMDGILIPRVLTNSKSKSKLSVSKTVKKSTKPTVSLADLDIPLDINLFKNVYCNHNDKFGTVSFTTLGDCRRQFFGIHNPKKWSFDELQSNALNYKRRVDFYRNSSASYYAAKRLNILEDITKHMDTVVRWDYETAKKKSLEYKSVKEYTSDSKNSGYHFAKSSGYYNEFISHMEKQWSAKWDFDSCKNEALKYETLNDFRKQAQGAYAWSKRNNCFDTITSHINKK
jgi:superfamily II DNA or RNA helicase